MKRNLCMLCLFVCITANAAVVWDGTSTPWTKGSGTEANPYLIETPSNLAYLSEQVKNGKYASAYFLQTEDFDMNSRYFTAIGSSLVFKGHYNGNGKYVSNLRFSNVSRYSALFSYAVDATICNVIIKGSFSTYSRQDYAAGILAHGKNVVLTNCVNMADIKVDSRYAAGIVAYIEGTECVIENCANRGKVYSSSSYYFDSPYYSYSGGIVGCNNGTCKLTSCSNMGMISASSYSPSSASSGTVYAKSYSYSGGIIGCNESICTLELCSNIGKITASAYSYWASSYPYSSGIVGYNSGNCALKCCYNTGYSSNGIVGGTEKCRINYCYSTNSSTNKLGGLVVATNSYFVDSLTQSSYGSTANGYCQDVVGNKMLKTKEQMQSPSFLSLLNAEGDYFCPDYTNINNGYPILRWQLGDTPFYTIRGICKAEQGTVSGAGDYPQGAQVKLTATPKDNYTFVGWSDGNTDNPRTISVDTLDVTYVAQFDRLSYTVYVNQDCSITVE